MLGLLWVNTEQLTDRERMIDPENIQGQ